MARIRNNGLLSGRLGDKVYFVINGKQVVREYVKNIKVPQTPAQIAARAKLVFGSRFSAKFNEVIKTGYQGAIKRTARNAFDKHLHAEVIKGVHPDFTIDYCKLKVAHGSIPQPCSIVAERCGNNLNLIWWDELPNYNKLMQSTDHLSVVMMNDNREVIYKRCVGFRTNESATIELPEDFGSFYVWAFYCAVSHRESMENVSDSVYLGKF